MRYITRELFPKITSHLKKPEITVVIGPRQVGKTVLLEQLQKYLRKQKVSSDRIFYFNLDIIRHRDFFSSQTELIKFLKSKIERKKIYLLVDEAQKVENPGIFFKGIYDSKLPLKMVLTGSSSLEIRAKLHESLAGRKRIFYLFPFSFQEVVKAQKPDLARLLKKEKDALSEYDKKTFLEIYQDYVIWGGYPRVVLTSNSQEKEDILAEIYSSYIEKDIVGFLKIKNPLSFNRLVKLLAGQVSQLVNIDELANSLSIDRETIEHYIDTLEKTFIIRQVRPYFSNLRKEVIKMPKYYFIDNGLLNYTLENFNILSQRGDKGKIFENSIFSELKFNLKRPDQLKFWRTKHKAEVDFIIERGQKIIPIEAKTSFKRLRIPLGLQSFITRYQPEKAFIVGLNFEEWKIYKKTKVYFFPPYRLSELFLET